MPAIVRYNSYSTDILTLPYTVSGTLAAAVGTARIYFGLAATIRRIHAGVGTAPTGASIIVDVNKNGTTLFTTQANRPTIAISSFSDTGNIPDVTSIASGDYLTIDIDQVGSTIKGSDLVITIDYTVNPKDLI